MKVQDIMTREVLTVGADATLNEALALMWSLDVGAVPVLDPDRRCVGVVTDRDVAMALYLHGELPAQIPVREVMSRQVYGCSPEDGLGTAEARMREHQIRRLPVVDPAGRLVGILALADLARAASLGVGPLTAGHLTRTLQAITTPRVRERPVQTLLDKLVGGG
jgi:CBS domain-containing protein